MAPDPTSVRSVARVFVTVAALTGTVYLLYRVRSVLALLAIAVFVAVALAPAVELLARHRIPRPLAILAVYAALAGGVVGVGLVVVPPVVDQVDALAQDLPGHLDELRRNPTFRRYDERYGITTQLEAQADRLPTHLADAAAALRSVTVTVFSAAVKLVTVLVIAFLLLLDGPRIVAWVQQLAGPRRRGRWGPVARDAYWAVSGYVAGNVVISLVAGGVAYVVLRVLGVPFALPLAVLVAFLDLIPLLGATVAGIAVALVTLFHHFPVATIVWILVVLVYQQVENQVVQPIIYRKTVDMHPLLVIVAVLAGAALLGILGVLLAIPVAATVQIVVARAWALRAAAEPTPAPAPGGDG